MEKNEMKKALVYTGLGLAMGLSIPTLTTFRSGDKEIIREYDEETDEYGVIYHESKEDYDDPREKYTINRGSTYVSFDEAVTSIIEECRNDGMDDVEIAIGLRNMFHEHKEFIEPYIDTTMSERFQARMDKVPAKQLVKKK